MGLGLKIAVAAVSGLCVAWSSRLPIFYHFIFPSVSWLCLAGVLFVVGVFFPYPRRERLRPYRLLGLLAIGAAGYWCAFWAGVFVTSEFDLDERLGYSVGCLVAAAIVLAGARLIVPLRHPTRLLFAGLVAAVVGGFVFWLPPALWRDSWFAWMTWHALMAVAVHTAQSSPLQTSGTG